VSHPKINIINPKQEHIKGCVFDFEGTIFQQDEIPWDSVRRIKKGILCIFCDAYKTYCDSIKNIEDTIRLSEMNFELERVIVIDNAKENINELYNIINKLNIYRKNKYVSKCKRITISKINSKIHELFLANYTYKKQKAFLGDFELKNGNVRALIKTKRFWDLNYFISKFDPLKNDHWLGKSLLSFSKKNFNNYYRLIKIRSDTQNLVSYYAIPKNNNFLEYKFIVTEQDVVKYIEVIFRNTQKDKSFYNRTFDKAKLDSIRIEYQFATKSPYYLDDLKIVCYDTDTSSCWVYDTRFHFFDFELPYFKDVTEITSTTDDYENILNLPKSNRKMDSLSDIDTIKRRYIKLDDLNVNFLNALKPVPLSYYNHQIPIPISTISEGSFLHFFLHFTISYDSNFKIEIIPMIDLRKSFCVNKNPQSIDYLYRVSNKMSIITKEISAEAAGMTFDNYSKIIEFHAAATNKIRSNIYKFDRNYKLDWYFEPNIRSLKKGRQ
jgi:hypothetical protein